MYLLTSVLSSNPYPRPKRVGRYAAHASILHTTYGNMAHVATCCPQSILPLVPYISSEGLPPVDRYEDFTHLGECMRYWTFSFPHLPRTIYYSDLSYTYRRLFFRGDLTLHTLRRTSVFSFPSRMHDYLRLTFNGWSDWWPLR